MSKTIAPPESGGYEWRLIYERLTKQEKKRPDADAIRHELEDYVKDDQQVINND